MSFEYILYNHNGFYGVLHFLSSLGCSITRVRNENFIVGNKVFLTIKKKKKKKETGTPYINACANNKH